MTTHLTITDKCRKDREAKAEGSQEVRCFYFGAVFFFTRGPKDGEQKIDLNNKGN